MMTQDTNTRSTQLQELCAAVRKYFTARDYQKCAAMICKAMGEFPNAPQPHNLFGIVLEKEGDHVGAMKHFRAAYALDPTYIPARQNLEVYGTFYSCGKCAFDESDCPEAAPSPYVIEYDETLIVEMIGMIMGRLEIFIVLTGIYFGLNRVKFIWREHKKARQHRWSEKTAS